MNDAPKAVGRRTILRGLAGSALLAGMGSVAAEHGDEDAYTTRDLTIESWDGAELACTVFEPTSSGPHPSMLMTHGWGSDRSSAFYPEVFASHGYVVLTYDSRGFGESGGEANSDGPAEVNDAKRLITWLGNADGGTDDRPNVKNSGPPSDHGPNPQVGMIGGSYAGGIQLNTAARDDRLDAIVPIIPWYDLAFSLEPNDVVKQGWGVLLYGVGITGTRGVTSGDGQPTEEDLRNGMDSNIHEAFVEGNAFNGFDENTETWYKERSPVSRMDEIAANDTPCLTVIGWPDTLFVPNEGIWIHQGLAERGVDSRLVLYNSGHTFADSEGQSEATLRRGLSFVEEHIGTPGRPFGSYGPTRSDPVEYFEVQSEGGGLDESNWTTATEMPPRNAERRLRTLDEAEATQSGQTVLVNSVAPTSGSQLSAENFDSPGTSANFDFPVEEAHEVVGTPTLSAQVRPLGTAAHLFWGFYHVRDGEATLVNNQVMPFRVARDRDAPGEPVTIEGELVSVQRFLEPGDTLRLTVSTTDAGFNSARQSVGAVVDHENTRVTIPVIPGSTQEEN